MLLEPRGQSTPAVTQRGRRGLGKAPELRCEVLARDDDLDDGLTFGKAVVRENGDFWDFAVGVYPLAVRPERAAKWQLKLGISYFFD